ncbi:MAG: hypothetical protein AAF196_08745 [Planctomycetota bacterium]
MTDREPNQTSRRDFFSLFLSGVAIGMATPLGAAGRGARAFGFAGRSRPELHPDLQAAARRARTLGKPLLVVRIPALTPEQRHAIEEMNEWYGDPDEKQAEAPEWSPWPLAVERGERLGLVLRYADTETLAAIATTEIVCANDAEIREVLGWTSEEDQKRELPSGAMLLIDLEPRRVQSVCDELPTADPVLNADGSEIRWGWEDPQRNEAIANAREAASLFGRRLESAMFGDAEHAAARLDNHRRSLGNSTVDFESADSGSNTDVRRCAGLYFAKARSIEPKSDQAPWFERLAELARLSLVSSDLPGARWVETLGCGADYTHPREDDAPFGIDCGMGWVHPTRDRYLVFRHR